MLPLLAASLAVLCAASRKGNGRKINSVKRPHTVPVISDETSVGAISLAGVDKPSELHNWLCMHRGDFSWDEYSERSKSLSTKSVGSIKYSRSLSGLRTVASGKSPLSKSSRSSKRIRAAQSWAASNRGNKLNDDSTILTDQDVDEASSVGSFFSSLPPQHLWLNMTEVERIHALPTEHQTVTLNLPEIQLSKSSLRRNPLLLRSGQSGQLSMKMDSCPDRPNGSNTNRLDRDEDAGVTAQSQLGSDLGMVLHRQIVVSSLIQSNAGNGEQSSIDNAQDLPVERDSLQSIVEENHSDSKSLARRKGIIADEGDDVTLEVDIQELRNSRSLTVDVPSIAELDDRSDTSSHISKTPLKHNGHGQKAVEKRTNKWKVLKHVHETILEMTEEDKEEHSESQASEHRGRNKGRQVKPPRHHAHSLPLNDGSQRAHALHVDVIRNTHHKHTGAHVDEEQLHQSQRSTPRWTRHHYWDTTETMRQHVEQARNGNASGSIARIGSRLTRANLDDLSRGSRHHIHKTHSGHRVQRKDSSLSHSRQTNSPGSVPSPSSSSSDSNSESETGTRNSGESSRSLSRGRRARRKRHGSGRRHAKHSSNSPPETRDKDSLSPPKEKEVDDTLAIRAVLSLLGIEDHASGSDEEALTPNATLRTRTHRRLANANIPADELPDTSVFEVRAMLGLSVYDKRIDFVQRVHDDVVHELGAIDAQTLIGRVLDAVAEEPAQWYAPTIAADIIDAEIAQRDTICHWADVELDIAIKQLSANDDVPTAVLDTARSLRAASVSIEDADAAQARAIIAPFLEESAPHNNMLLAASVKLWLLGALAEDAHMADHKLAFLLTRWKTTGRTDADYMVSLHLDFMATALGFDTARLSDSVRVRRAMSAYAVTLHTRRTGRAASVRDAGTALGNTLAALGYAEDVAGAIGHGLAAIPATDPQTAVRIAHAMVLAAEVWPSLLRADGRLALPDIGAMDVSLETLWQHIFASRLVAHARGTLDTMGAWMLNAVAHQGAVAVFMHSNHVHSVSVPIKILLLRFLAREYHSGRLHVAGVHDEADSSVIERMCAWVLWERMRGLSGGAVIEPSEASAFRMSTVPDALLADFMAMLPLTRVLLDDDFETFARFYNYLVRWHAARIDLADIVPAGQSVYDTPFAMERVRALHGCYASANAAENEARLEILSDEHMDIADSFHAAVASRMAAERGAHELLAFFALSEVYWGLWGGATAIARNDYSAPKTVRRRDLVAVLWGGSERDGSARVAKATDERLDRLLFVFRAVHPATDVRLSTAVGMYLVDIVASAHGGRLEDRLALTGLYTPAGAGLVAETLRRSGVDTTDRLATAEALLLLPMGSLETAGTVVEGRLRCMLGVGSLPTVDEQSVFEAPLGTETIHAESAVTVPERWTRNGLVGFLAAQGVPPVVLDEVHEALDMFADPEGGPNAPVTHAAVLTLVTAAWACMEARRKASFMHNSSATSMDLHRVDHHGLASEFKRHFVDVSEHVHRAVISDNRRDYTRGELVERLELMGFHAAFAAQTLYRLRHDEHSSFEDALATLRLAHDSVAVQRRRHEIAIAQNDL